MSGKESLPNYYEAQNSPQPRPSESYQQGPRGHYDTSQPPMHYQQQHYQQQYRPQQYQQYPPQQYPQYQQPYYQQQPVYVQQPYYSNGMSGGEACCLGLLGGSLLGLCLF